MEPIPRPTLAPRPEDAHKHAVGTVLVIGGSVGLAGAPVLVARGAFAAGAGLVTLAVPAPLRTAVAALEPLALVRPVAATASGGCAYPALGTIRALADRVDAVVLGPGLGPSEATRALARRLLESTPQPTVVDADALAAAPPRGTLRVATPHEGEAARLLDWPVARVSANREEAARCLQERLGGVIVLKGPGTLVTDGQRMQRATTGNPCLAVGGTGDVLAGILGSLLARGMDPFAAASAAVWIHGAAADAVVSATGVAPFTPTDLIRGVGVVVRALELAAADRSAT